VAGVSRPGDAGLLADRNCGIVRTIAALEGRGCGIVRTNADPRAAERGYAA
jgi:hypothetical protein